MVLLDEAVRAEALGQLQAFEAAAFPYLEERARARLVHTLRQAMLAPAEREKQVDANWALLRTARGLH